ncbi:MAG: hypothetical protein H7Y17_02745 [Chlorobia bacterium]|nr:hypothetical protein [Fimbriimonadaceae bacterium]
MEFVGNTEEYRAGYADQAKFVGKQMLSAIDKLLASSKEQPVIILQGDHGPKKGLDQASLAKTDVNECFPILNAYLVPEAVKSKLYPGITPVNTFRAIFREMFGDSLPNLPDRSWYSPYPQPLEFTEVTSQVK